MRGADPAAEERPQRAGLRRPERGEVDEAGQHSQHGRQLRRHVLPTLRRQDIRAALEGKVRPVFDQNLEPDRPGCVAQAERDRGHRPEVPDRPQTRAVATGSAAVERSRRRRGAVDVGENRLARPLQADAAALTNVPGNGGAGSQEHPGHDCKRCEPRLTRTSAGAGPATRSSRPAVRLSGRRRDLWRSGVAGFPRHDPQLPHPIRSRSGRSGLSTGSHNLGFESQCRPSANSHMRTRLNPLKWT